MKQRPHALPKRYHRYERQGTLFEVLIGPETARQRYIREQSLARYMRRPGVSEPQLFKGEVGQWFGIRIIETAA